MQITNICEVRHCTYPFSFIGLKNEEIYQLVPTKSLMTDAEFHNFMNGVGQMVQPQSFRLMVYQGGVESSLRKVVWRHLLNIFPDELTGKERFDYLRNKSSEYCKLRDKWKHVFSIDRGTESIKSVCNMVKKDVIRTDRTHDYYAGTDENEHIISLFNILVTYALTHPELGYCQGMSDLASPILFVQKDEAHAYICFCGLMQRLRANFLLEGSVMTGKFTHLALILQHFDTKFYDYLLEHNTQDLFFCYRWLLLELKREFPLDDALYMLEVMWSSLPPDPPEHGIPLADATYYSQGLNAYKAPQRFSGQGYLKLLSRLRCNSLNASQTQSEAEMPRSETKTGETRHKRTEVGTPGVFNPTEFPLLENNMSCQAKDKGTSIDVSLVDCLKPLQTSYVEHKSVECVLNERTTSDDHVDKAEAATKEVRRPDNIGFKEGLRPCTSPLSATASDPCSSCEEASENPAVEFDGNIGQVVLTPLPSPQDIGHGNPFLLFLCLAMLAQHRDHIMDHNMDYDEVAMYFHKLVRQHNVYEVVHRAKSLYGIYLKKFRIPSPVTESTSI